MTKTIFPKSLEERDDEIQPSRYTIAALHDYTESEPEIPFWRDEKRGRVNGEWKKYTAAKNEIYQRYSLPFALPAFILIAIPLAVELRPRAKSVSFLIAMGLILVYYVMITWAGTLGARNHPLTPFAFMLPNFLIGGIGLLLFWRVERQ
jgi:lipopolysaccharide export system permease protein